MTGILEEWVALEEFWLPAMERFFVNTTVRRYCWMNWDGELTTTHVDEHRKPESQFPLVKRVKRDTADPVRQYIEGLRCADCRSAAYPAAKLQAFVD